MRKGSGSGFAKLCAAWLARKPTKRAGIVVSWLKCGQLSGSYCGLDRPHGGSFGEAAPQPSRFRSGDVGPFKPASFSPSGIRGPLVDCSFAESNKLSRMLL